MLILLTAILAIAERNHISPAIAALSLSQVHHIVLLLLLLLSLGLQIANHCLLASFVIGCRPCRL